MNITRSMSGLTLLFVLSLVCSFTPTAIAQNYYPSEIGNTWVFLSVDRTEQRTYTLEGPENINGQELTVLKITRETPGTDAAAIDDKYFITVDSDGGLILHQSAVDQGTFGVAEATYDPPAPFFPAVLPIGRKWEIVAEVVLKIVGPTTSVSTIEVVDIEDIETPIGTFKDCVKLQITRKVTTALGIQRYNLVQWLAPEVGPVKYLDADQDILFELESYELVEAPSADDAAADDTADAADDATADADTVSDDAADDTAADDTSDDIISDDAAADDTAVDDTAEEDAADDADAAEEDAADDAVEEDAAVDDTAEEDAAVDDATAEPVVEEPMPEPEPVSYGFDVTLAPGLNMMSVPLMPEEPYTAKSLAEMLGATVVIQFDVGTQSFAGYTVADSGDGFGIEGGEGYIVNTPAGASVKFTGSAWDNQPEPEPVVEEPAAEEEVAEEPAADDAAEEVAEELLRKKLLKSQPQTMPSKKLLKSQLRMMPRKRLLKSQLRTMPRKKLRMTQPLMLKSQPQTMPRKKLRMTQPLMLWWKRLRMTQPPHLPSQHSRVHGHLWSQAIFKAWKQVELTRLLLKISALAV